MYTICLFRIAGNLEPILYNDYAFRFIINYPYTFYAMDLYPSFQNIILQFRQNITFNYILSMIVKLHFKLFYRMTLFSRILILSPHLYCLITLTTQQTRTTPIKSQSEDSVFSWDGSRLRLTEDILKIISRFPIPKF